MCGDIGGPTSQSYRNPAKTHVFTDSCSEPTIRRIRNNADIALPYEIDHLLYSTSGKENNLIGNT